MTGFCFSGPLSETKRQFWGMARKNRSGGKLPVRDAPVGQLAWGAERGPMLAGSLGPALVFAALAWLLGGWRVDTRLWPLWAMAGAFLLGSIVNLLFVERFVLDTQARRWHYRRGWRGIRVREEGGPFADLSGWTLEEFRRPLPNCGTTWVLVLEFADGLRFADLGGPMYDTAEAHTEARRVTIASGLPLREKPLRT